MAGNPVHRAVPHRIDLRLGWGSDGCRHCRRLGCILALELGLRLAVLDLLV